MPTPKNENTEGISMVKFGIIPRMRNDLIQLRGKIYISTLQYNYCQL